MRMTGMTLWILLGLLGTAPARSMATLQVGPGRTLALPSQAAAVAQNGAAVDPGVMNTANEFKSFTCMGPNGTKTFNYLEKVGTFDPNDPIEIRDNAAGAIALGADGFNVPSLLSINYSAPYLHRGQAQTLEQVFPLHGLGPQGAVFPPTTTIANTLTAAQQSDLLVFLKAIDGTTPPFRSEGDDFRDTIRLLGPCP